MKPTDSSPKVQLHPTAAEAAAAMPASTHAASQREQVRAFGAIMELTKPRITRLVTITSAVGFVMAALGRQGWGAADLLMSAVGAIVGTALSAAGANALNQWMERGRDSVMPRTMHRPLPDSRVSPLIAAVAGTGLCVAGVAVLWAMAGITPALVSVATILSYLLLYTPLKPVTPLATLVGAVPGALPPLIGWTAAMGAGTGLAGWEAVRWTLGGAHSAGGWALFVLMLVWQIPHFLAIAWMYRDDYAKGGYKVLPVVDPTGSSTAAVILVWTAILVLASAAPAMLMPDQLGPLYLAVVALTGLPFFYAAARLAKRRSRADAKLVFVASIVHLPVLLVAMVADGLIRSVV